MVLHDVERQLIESVFGCRVYNRYGCEELSIIASESEENCGLHLFAEGVYLEPLGTDRRNPGEIVVTDLLNRAMPLIRYRIGDFGTDSRDSHSARRGLPILSSIEGRTADFLYRPDGSPVFGISILDTFVIHIDGIKQMQIIQNDLRKLEIKIVKSSTFSSATMDAIRKTIEKQFGSEMDLELQYVDRIPQTRRGKYRFAICNIDRH